MSFKNINLNPYQFHKNSLKMDIKTLHQLFLKHKTLCIDTRKVVNGCIFLAIKGEKHNANQFAHEAIKNGAAYAIIDEPEYQINDQFILVDNTLQTLQELASFHCQSYQIPIIAIAGSNGKTTTKELITSVLSKKYRVLSTPGNYNNHIGLPLTILQITDYHKIAVIEMGANHIGENEFLCQIAQPTHGLVTNNGKDHLEGFGSMEGVVKSNSELYQFLLKNNGKAIVNANDQALMQMTIDLDNKLTYAANFKGRESTADVECFAEMLQPTIQFKLKNNPLSINSNLSGDYNFDNIAAAVAIGLLFDLTPSEIAEGIENYKPSNNRSEIIKKVRNTIYLDAYNANPSSMELAIKNFAAMPFGNKVLILGDMFELGKYAHEEHQNLVEYCVKLGLNNVYLCGDLFKQTQHDFISFSNTTDLKNYLAKEKILDANIFIKGSRSMKLETLLDVIE